MRFHRPLDEILGRKSKVALLRYLVMARREATGRDLARSTGIDHKTCLESLRDLTRSDLVRQRRAGRAWIYTLNAGFPIVDQVLKPLFEWERGIPERFARDLRRLVGRDALSIFLFGSTAKGTDRGESDIDLLAVSRPGIGRQAFHDRLVEASLALQDKYGRSPRFLIMNVREFRTRYLKNEWFLAEILRSGRHLGGLREEEILEHGRPPNRRARVSPR